MVQPGDALSVIAERYGVTPSAIVAANRLINPDYILIGQELVIPGEATIRRASDIRGTGGGAGGHASRARLRYLVEEGDSLHSVAGSFGTDIESLVRLNGLTDANLIRAGDYLLIP